jgi:hypothetical protein
MLSSYSTQVLATLQSLLPDLAALATEQGEYFIIQTSSPSGRELLISSADQEVTVGFAHYYMPFGWEESTPQQDATDIDDFINELRDGTQILVTWYTSKHVGSSMRQVSEEWLLPTWLQKPPAQSYHLEINKWA